MFLLLLTGGLGGAWWATSSAGLRGGAFEQLSRGSAPQRMDMPTLKATLAPYFEPAGGGLDAHVILVAALAVEVAVHLHRRGEVDLEVLVDPGLAGLATLAQLCRGARMGRRANVRSQDGMAERH